MKIIHTGDWHIGKLVHQIHMTEDQRHILEQFVELVRDERPDVVVIAGDLYDRSVPPVEAVELLDEVFTKILVDIEIPIIAIAGNHDSPDRVGFASKVLRERGLHIEGRFKGAIKPVILEDEHGPVNFYLLPYADPAMIRDVMGVKDIRSHDDSMKVIIDNIKETMNKNERNVLVGHAFVTGTENIEASDSVRPLSIGGTEYVDVGYFQDFHYTALGHLHRPQKVAHERVRYSGSLMKYSFSEAKQKKSITMVHMDGNGAIEIEEKRLSPLRDMRQLKGKLEDLLAPYVYKGTNVEDYVMVTLEDEGELIDPIGKLRAVYPNVLRVDRVAYTRSEESLKTSAGRDHEKKTKGDLFHDFYKAMTGKDFTEDKKTILMDVLKDVEKQERGE